MLKIALPYIDQLRELFLETWYREEYKYYNIDVYYDLYKPTITEEEGDYRSREFVSVYNNRIIGYIEYSINRISNIVTNVCIIRFSHCQKNQLAEMMQFSRDVMQVVDDIFMKFNHEKINFYCIKDNPARKMYEKFISKNGGTYVGTQRKNQKLMDNKYYDDCLYEILKEDYMKERRNR